jgi:hypothetical protein
MANIVATFLALILGVWLVSAGLSQTYYSEPVVSSSPALGLYQDSGFTKPVQAIEWGELIPSGSANSTLYVRNIGGVPLEIRLNAYNWLPVNASDFITISWDREGLVLQPDQFTVAKLTMRVGSDITIITKFRVDLSIDGYTL